MSYESTKVIELGSCAFRQWRAEHSHCRFIHGYQLKAKLWFAGEELDDKNWIVDFGGLKDLKRVLQEQFDHTTVVAADDPKLETFKELDRQGIIQLRVMEDGVGIERTAEYVFKVADEYVDKLTDGRCWCAQVEVFEHEDNSATFSPSVESLVYKNLEKEVVEQLISEVKEVPSDPPSANPVEPSRRPAPVGQGPTDRSLKDILGG